MRLHVLSDLHLEFAPFTVPSVDADVVILAGDTHPGLKGVEWAAATWPDRPVLYLLGNHELYGHTYPRLVHKLEERVAELGAPIHVLAERAVSFDGVRFLGTTLWTDFRLLGTPDVSMAAAQEHMTDFRRIRVEPSFRRCRPADTVMWHQRARRWLEGELRAAGDGKTVVLTHHAPCARSLNPLYQDAIAAAYASAMEDVVAASGAVLWIHGHTHYPADYELGGTRVLSNQRGYPDEPVFGYEPGLVVSV